MVPELRLVRYFVAVAQERNITRAAERLHLSQPSLSAAMKQLEAQLGVPLLDRSGRELGLTAAGELLLRRGQELLDMAALVAEEVRARGEAPSARLRLGLTPTARYGVGPALLAACAAAAPAVMIYTSEDTTGALLRDVASGRLDAAVVFCPPDVLPGDVELFGLPDEPAVLHVRDDHRLAARSSVRLDELEEETVLIAAGQDSSGFTILVLRAFVAAGVEPRTRSDPYPDLGLQAVREGLGVVVYVRSAFPPDLEGSTFVPIEPLLTLPFALAYRDAPPTAAIETVIAIAGGL